MERFIRFDEEEKKRKVMGLSTFRRAAELKVLVDAAAPQRQGNECDAGMAARILGEKPVLKASWTEDTCRRCLLISEQLNTVDKHHDYLGDEIWTHLLAGFLDHNAECRHGGPVRRADDHIGENIVLGADMQDANFSGRSHKGWRRRQCHGVVASHFASPIVLPVHPADLPEVGRHSQHLRDMEVVSIDVWHGRARPRQQNRGLERLRGREKNKEEESGAQTRFESKRRLKIMMDQVAKGKYDTSFVSMARAHSSSMNLDLGCEGMANIQKLVNDLYTLYKTEFPDEPRQAAVLPSTEVDVNASAGVYTPVHVKASSRIESQEEYQAKLSAYQEECRKAQ